jgi:hypothetical protein
MSYMEDGGKRGTTHAKTQGRKLGVGRVVSRNGTRHLRDEMLEKLKVTLQAMASTVGPLERKNVLVVAWKLDWRWSDRKLYR